MKREDLHIRDPFIYTENGIYYLLGTTGSDTWERGSDLVLYVSRDLERFEKKCVLVTDGSLTSYKNIWAPELHLYRGKYYLILSVFRDDIGRGSLIFVSDALDETFKMLTGKYITPEDWGCLDATLFIYKNTPYLCFSNEWMTPIKKINLRLMEIEAKMTEYLSDLSLNDDIEEKIESMNKKKEKYEALKTEMESKGVKEISTTDKDARLMKANNQGTDVSYNVQSVVDSKYKLIAGMEVVCSASDNGLLGRVMPRIKEELGLEETTVLADTGYYKAKDFDVCENRGIYPIVAKQKERAGDLIKIDEFEYDAKEDVYICPNNKKLTRKGIVSEYYYRYMNASGCKKCPQKAKCTTGGWREIKRNIWKESADRNDRRLSENKGLYKQRQALAEHPFGTMKRAMGVRQFLTRGKTNVAAEVALIFLCYNLKRLRKIMTQNPIMNGAFPRLRAV